VERFRAVAKCDKEEASFYLEEHEFDVERALAAFRADLEWEKQAPQPQKARGSGCGRCVYRVVCVWCGELLG
jgi:CRISPR/Cas system-associated exonuclease Cas4 (RecB family)